MVLASVMFLLLLGGVGRVSCAKLGAGGKGGLLRGAAAAMDGVVG